MPGNNNLHDSSRNKQDEFYTNLQLVENELKHYRAHFKGKRVLCNCDAPYESNFFKDFAMSFNSLGLKKLFAICYDGFSVAYTQLDLFGEGWEATRVSLPRSEVPHRGSGVSPLQAFTYSPCGDLLATHTYTNNTDILTENYAYDMLGNRIATTDAHGNTTYRTYDPLGNLTAEWGATYPVRYTYDTQGRRTSLTTFRTTGAVALVATGGDTTMWTYDPYTSLCTSKTYADGSTVTYTYTPDNLLLRTTYASGKWKENIYNAQRRLCGVVYSSSDMDYELQLDAYGRTVWESNSVCSVAYALAEVGTATNEVASVGGEAMSVARTLDGQDRLVGLAIPDSGYRANNAYADDGNIQNISNDLASVSYLYSSNRLDVGYSIRLANGTTIQRNLYRDDFRRSLVTNITTVVNGNSVESLNYSFDAAGRPIARNDDTFGYNARSEVVSATIGGNSETHAYDDIGNSLRATFNAVTNTFVANNLNQYTAISRNTLPHRETSHDIDGNMTQCGDWTYAYDAGHQLKSVSSNGVLLVTNYYDAKSRRVRKVTPDATITFFYDDWNLIEERISYANGTASLIRYYWGKDLSGTLQGVGGIGGLLYLMVDGAIYIPFYDNNGNITRYLDANGNTVAQYTYDAFGNTISKSGPLADFFRHRFSTKYYDAETGLYYYGYRFYHPLLMRWLNRDLLEEDGGINLYEFANNTAIMFFDPTGESPYVLGEQEPPRRTVLATGTWNTMAAPSGTWMIRVRAKLTVWGGSWRSMPDASRHLQHFLSNSGTPLNVRFREMNRESGSAKMHLERELRDAITYAEKLANSDGGFVMVTPSETGNLNSEGNWLYAVGRYTTWARASVVKCGEKFSMNWHFYFRDIYDWELDNGAGGGLVTDREMALLHRYGLAREYEMNGRQFINVDWKKGQQFNSGARIRGL